MLTPKACIKDNTDCELISFTLNLEFECNDASITYKILPILYINSPINSNIWAFLILLVTLLTFLSIVLELKRLGLYNNWFYEWH